MILIIWEYRVKPEYAGEFETLYSPRGEWVHLFSKHAGYLHTELLKKKGNRIPTLLLTGGVPKMITTNFFSLPKKSMTALMPCVLPSHYRKLNSGYLKNEWQIDGYIFHTVF